MNFKSHLIYFPFLKNLDYNFNQMPANLTPEYFEAEKLYKQAKTPEERISALEQMLAVIPKHKGTEKLQAEIKRKLAKLREAQEKAPKKGPRRSSQYYIAKEGAGQVVLVGPPNSGKSSILSAFTKAQVEIAEYPYTTRKLQPGMMTFENVQIQLVDTPPISQEYFEPWMSTILRNADGVLFVVNLASLEILDEIEMVLEKLEARKIHLTGEVEEKFEPEGRANLRTLLVGTHLDQPSARENLEVIQEIYQSRFPVVGISISSGEGLKEFPKKVFDLLEIVRVYTKAPGKPPDLNDPVILPKGSTVYDFAFEIHKELAKNLKYARIWGKNKFEGQRVPRDYVLADEDICELHS